MYSLIPSRRPRLAELCCTKVPYRRRSSIFPPLFSPDPRKHKWCDRRIISRKLFRREMSRRASQHHCALTRATPGEGARGYTILLQLTSFLYCYDSCP